MFVRWILYKEIQLSIVVVGFVVVLLVVGFSFVSGFLIERGCCQWLEC